MSLTTNLVAYYKLNDLTDATGNGNTLTNHNSAVFDAGLIGNGVDFGTSGSKFLNIAHDFGNPPYSISGWVKLNQEITSSYYTLFSIKSHATGASSTNTNLLYYYNGGTIQLLTQIYRTSNYSPTYNVTLGTSTWHHIVFTDDGTNQYQYLDGTQIMSNLGGTGTQTIASNAEFAIGEYVANNGLYALAKEDEVGIWTRALSSSEVTQLYNGGAGLQYPFITTNSSAAFLTFI